MEKTKGSFTLPGEAGYEELTLKLAERWGADVIRDSDGTELSEEITGAGYGIYSTICLIRDHNEWAKAHPEDEDAGMWRIENAAARLAADRLHAMGLPVAIAYAEPEA